MKQQKIWKSFQERWERLKKKAPNLVVPTSWVGKVGGVIEADCKHIDFTGQAKQFT
ncbi:hypothetical protein ACLSY0_02260 [Avibacterium avium]|uniref:hypothetical protein n=1 Tax=Avibacterium avium TaxID=751 RepID=UPI003BF87CB4